MGFKASKNFKLPGGARLNVNVSSKVVGMTVGFNGARVRLGKRSIMKTASIPETDVQHTNTSLCSKKSTSKNFKTQMSYPKEFTVADLKKRTGKFNRTVILIATIIATIGVPFLWFLPMIVAAWYWNGNQNGLFANERYWNIARELIKKEEYIQAIAPLEEALEANPADLEACELLISLYAELLQDYERSIELIDYALTMVRDSSQRITMTLVKAEYLIFLECYMLAVETAADLGLTDHDPSGFLIAQAYIFNGDYNVAIEVLKGLSLSRKRIVTPDLIELKYLLGTAYLLSGDKKRAQSPLNAVLAYDRHYKNIQKLITEF